MPGRHLPIDWLGERSVNLHFTQAEFAGRIAVARQRMSEQALDGLLLFKQESMYYLSGYDTDGFVLFLSLIHI